MGYPDILEWFFERKGGKKQVNVRDRNKRTPCHDAAEYGYTPQYVLIYLHCSLQTHGGPSSAAQVWS